MPLDRGGGASASSLAMSLEELAPASKSVTAQNPPAPHCWSRDSIARTLYSKIRSLGRQDKEDGEDANISVVARRTDHKYSKMRGRGATNNQGRLHICKKGRAVSWGKIRQRNSNNPDLQYCTVHILTMLDIKYPAVGGHAGCNPSPVWGLINLKRLVTTRTWNNKFSMSTYRSKLGPYRRKLGPQSRKL
jgi:hypothetical protein